MAARCLFNCSLYRLLLGLIILFLELSNGGQAEGMRCDLRPCAIELYFSCPLGLQTDRTGCEVCACRPAPSRMCSVMTCRMLCAFSRQHVFLICPLCPCSPPDSIEMQKTVSFGGSPEQVNAAMTGQIKITTRNVMQRHAGMCTTVSRRWRTMDGTCNNARNLGATFLPASRLLPPTYDDGRQSPRTSSVRGMGQSLPSARLVSRTVHTHVNTTDRFTNMFMQFGQFIDHDITSFPLPTEGDRAIKCCTETGFPIFPPPHRDCFPIAISGDPYFYAITCMDFVRSVPAVDEDGNVLLPRENVNSQTAFVDGSVVYGSSEELMRELRENNGTGIFLRTSYGSFLPRDSKESCLTRQTSDPCFVAGDERVNEQPGLTTLHTIFMREHNRIAFNLRIMLPQDSDEDIFQRTRAIVGAILQNVLFGQWLPLVLGPVNMHRYGLNTGRVMLYNSDIDPRITNVFSTAAFRFGHSMIPETLQIGDRSPRLRDLFNKPFEVYDNLNKLASGLINSTRRDSSSSSPHGAQRVDRHFVPEITNHLFQPRDRPFSGLDLVALNIQRGRDHGLPSFTRFRRYCGLRDVTGFSDPVFGTAGSDLERVYSDVNDIDIFTGGMVEARADGSVVGPTLACILARQFHSLKYGDRFYFEVFRGPSLFTPSQMAELRKTSLGWVLCHNLNLPAVQRDVFTAAGPDNPMTTCAEVMRQGLDLSVLATTLVRV